MLSPVMWLLLAGVVLFVGNIFRQLLPKPQGEPPMVFHWIPIIGNAVEYGRDPIDFLRRCQAKHGDVFTFILFGMKLTCCLGTDGNDFVLNGKHANLSAKDIYGPLTIPIFGPNVVYDCPSSKLVEQKRFVKFGITTQALQSYVPLISQEVRDYVSTESTFQGKSGIIDVTKSVSEITIFTATRSLQGEEVRSKMTTEMSSLYHDLDNGFQPVNFLLPWFPFPHNRKRDAARAKMFNIYADIVQNRRQGNSEKGTDLIWHLMECTYKDGTPVPDDEIVNMMITLLMGGQHSSASAVSWIIFHLAANPEMTEELYQEQIHALGRNGSLPSLEYEDLAKLPLMRNAIKETLRCHNSIHSVMRQVKQPMPYPGTDYVITPDKVVLASPIVTALDDRHFHNAGKWDPHRWDSMEQEDEDPVLGDKPESVEAAELHKATKSPYLPFGAGRHRCIGEKFAYVQLGAIVATLVREFRFSTVDGRREVPETDYACMFSRPVQPAPVRWERRAEKVSV